MKPTEKVREHIKNKEWKEALRIAKDFRLNVTKEQKNTMTRAYECIVHPDFYRQIGKDVDVEIQKGVSVLNALFTY